MLLHKRYENGMKRRSRQAQHDLPTGVEYPQPSSLANLEWSSIVAAVLDLFLTKIGHFSGTWLNEESQ